MPHAPSTPFPSALARRGPWALLACLLVLFILAVASIGGPLTGFQGAASAVYWIARAGLPAALFIASSIGLGWLARPLFQGARRRWAIQAAVGLSLQLTIGHLINCAGGWLPGLLWNYAALAPGLLGLALLAFSLWRDRSSKTSLRPRGLGIWTVAAGACALALAVMLVAACEAPGVLWASEFGGFDALSYHLQLPREWLELGRLTPLNHNVYSYLPSYLESAFLTLQLRTFAPRTTPSGITGMLADDGWRALAGQFLHAGFGVVASWLVASATRELIARSNGAKDDADVTERDGAWLAGAAFFCVPWVVVVGSMAYNELAVCAMFAGAMLVALDRGLSQTSRALLVGWLVGVACGIKPTAILFAAPPLGLALLWVAPVRSWIRVGVLGCLLGLAALLPWMVRNWLASGNPVFPYAHGIFGDGHWTAEQHARFAGAHHFDGTWLERVRLLFMVDPSDPAGPRHRGMMHPQWSGFFPVVAVAGLIGFVAARIRRCASVLIGALLMQVIAWLMFTHLQSRFLLPLAVPGAMLIGLVGSGAWLPPASARIVLYRRLVMLVTALCTGFFAMRSLDAFWSEQGGHPNKTLGYGPEGLARTDLRIGDRAQVDPGERLYLMGDSTPFYIPGPLVYHTTWDASPLGDAVRATSADVPLEWSGKLRDRGIDKILVNFSELSRLIESKWYDPAVTPEIFRRWQSAGGFERVPPKKFDGVNPPDVIRPLGKPERKP